ncbi:complement decay-accelerating factor-like isoform X2 [Dendropsophus ebraccatus]|uniref:complement decay-accelerating factor-like isoform X2 n=1 Tax=Dendropsophus ebraccatus TaxID=150705 RepID=UPI00383154AF
MERDRPLVYRLVGDSSRECMEDKTWSGSVPTCQRSCPDPPVLDYAEVIELPEDQYFPREIFITYRCLPGYKYDLFLSPTVQCLEDFTWSGTTLFCKKVDCGDPERIKNGKIQVTGTDFGSIAVYSCNIGYSLTENSHRKCTADGVWEGNPPQCK